MISPNDPERTLPFASLPAYLWSRGDLKGPYS
jgi:hypothetical protein